MLWPMSNTSAEKEWRRRITSGVFQAMAAKGRMERRWLAGEIGVSLDTVNRYLNRHEWTLSGFIAAAVACGVTPVEILGLGAKPSTEHLP